MDISVVIPLYNKAAHISRALDSVLAQNEPASEVIVVDDGSTDNGADIVRRYDDERIRLICQSNQGASAARNRGIAEAQTELVGFLDADDEWKPGFLPEIQRLWSSFPGCGIYATSGIKIGRDSKVHYPDLGGAPPEPWIGTLPSFFKAFRAGWPFYTSSVAIPKTVLDEVGGFPHGVSLAEDVDCWVRIALRYPIAFSSARLFIYHQEAENRSALHICRPKEYGFVRLVRDAIGNGGIPPEQREDALEFMAFSQMTVASANISGGNPAYARELLRSCRRTRIHAGTWRRLMLLAMLPPLWPARLLAAKSAIAGFFGRRK
jgi:glycosyltransferase involved in cell wall biosynthesis